MIWPEDFVVNEMVKAAYAPEIGRITEITEQSFSIKFPDVVRPLRFHCAQAHLFSLVKVTEC